MWHSDSLLGNSNVPRFLLLFLSSRDSPLIVTATYTYQIMVYILILRDEPFILLHAVACLLLFEVLCIFFYPSLWWRPPFAIIAPWYPLVAILFAIDLPMLDLSRQAHISSHLYPLISHMLELLTENVDLLLDMFNLENWDGLLIFSKCSDTTDPKSTVLKFCHIYWLAQEPKVHLSGIYSVISEIDKLYTNENSRGSGISLLVETTREDAPPRRECSCPSQSSLLQKRQCEIRWQSTFMKALPTLDFEQMTLLKSYTPNHTLATQTGHNAFFLWMQCSSSRWQQNNAISKILVTRWTSEIRWYVTRQVIKVALPVCSKQTLGYDRAFGN